MKILISVSIIGIALKLKLKHSKQTLFHGNDENLGPTSVCFDYFFLNKLEWYKHKEEVRVLLIFFVYAFTVGGSKDSLVKPKSVSPKRNL